MNTEGLDALKGMCEEADAANPAGQAQAAQAEQEQEQQESAGDAWGTLIYSIGSMATAAIPKLEKVWTKDQCRLIGHALVPVAEKYNWAAPSSSPELTLAFATVPLAFGTYVVVKEWAQEQREAKRQAALQKRGNTAADVVDSVISTEGDQNHGG